MEDIDLIMRLSKQAKIKSMRAPIYTNGRKWKNDNIIAIACKNARLRSRWKSGEESSKLSKDYYIKKKKL